jgi:hypothetical protein
MRVECVRPPGHASVVEINVDDPMSNVPTWIWINFERIDQPSKTTPMNHYFATASGRHGYPGELLQIATRYVSGETDGLTCETEFLVVLAGWSRNSAS